MSQKLDRFFYRPTLKQMILLFILYLLCTQTSADDCKRTRAEAWSPWRYFNPYFNSYKGDGYCDRGDINSSDYDEKSIACLNTEWHDYDGGDCCEETCESSLYFQCGINGYNCQDPNATTPSPTATYPTSSIPSNCTATDKSKIGDGQCDGGSYNTAECAFDGGDCCIDTCIPREYTCIEEEFECLDPAIKSAPLSQSNKINLNVTEYCAKENQCNGLNMTCDGNSTCVFECSGKESCLGSTIYGNPSADLIVYCSNTSSCAEATINCPRNRQCDVLCSRDGACNGDGYGMPMIINGTAAANLSVIVSGSYVAEALFSSIIYCPEQLIYGDINAAVNNTCNIFVDGRNGNAFGLYNKMSTWLSIFSQMNIHSLHSWLGLNFQCLNPPCHLFWDRNPWPVLLKCGANYVHECELWPVKLWNETDVQSEWKCKDPNSICQHYTPLPTLEPSSSPTLEPTTSVPTFSPTKYNPNDGPPVTLYISQKNGCDSGKCQVKNSTLNCSLSSERSAPPTACNVNNTFEINKSGTFNTATSGDVVKLGDTFYGAQYPIHNRSISLCYNVSNDISCVPKVNQLLYEETPTLYDVGASNTNMGLNVAYESLSNILNDKPCKGSWPQCDKFSACALDKNVNDIFWNNNVYAFYFNLSLINAAWRQKSADVVDEQVPSDLECGIDINIKMELQCSEIETTCQTFNYAWNCLNGLPDDCLQFGYDGNGKIKMNEGTYSFDEDISIKHQQIILEGSGYIETTFEHNGNIDCDFRQCYLTISNLTYSTNHSAQIRVNNEGNVNFYNVLFQNDDELKFEFFDYAKVEFFDCIFSNTSLQFVISDNADVSFGNCQFESLITKKSLITVSVSTVSISQSVFKNLHNFTSVIQISDNSNVTLTNSEFVNNSNIDNIWNAVNSFGALLNTTNDCQNICIVHMDGELYIDDQSASNQTVQFGLSDNAKSAIFYPNVDIDPKNVHSSVDFINFENETIKYLPCADYDPASIQQTLFDQASDDLNSTESFDERGQFHEQNFTCPDTSLCFVECIAALSCYDASFLSHSTQIALFSCFGDDACGDSVIEIVEAKTSNIVCVESESCQGMFVYVNDSDSFVLECVQSKSCNQISVFINNTANVQIHCYGINACDEMKVHSDTNDIEINIYSFNEYIQIKVPSEYLPSSLNCNPMKAALRLDGMSFNGSLKEAARDLFGGDMPCQNVIFSFNQTNKVDCDIRYEHDSNNAIDERLTHLTDEMECFPPIYIDDISNYYCFGTKNPTNDPTSAPSQSPTQLPTRFPTSLDNYNAFINVSYFIGGMTTADIDTLSYENFQQSVIDITNMIEFGYVDHQLNNGDGGWKLNFFEFYVEIRIINDMEMHYLLEHKRPDYILTTDCWNPRWNIPCHLKLECTIYCEEANCIYIRSRYNEKLFEETVTMKFKQYLDIPDAAINGDIFFNVTSMSDVALLNPPIETDEWFEIWQNWIYIILALMVIFVCFSIFCYKHRMKRLRASKAMNVRNPLVLCVAIGEYEKYYEQDNEVGGFMCDLTGIEHDVDHMVDLFETRLKYDVFPKVNASNPPQTDWSESQMQTFLETQAKYLSNNIDSGKKYDSLVLIISCHGIPQYLCTSDYKKYSKIAVHRTFSFYANLRTIPRFILFDCCQGAYSREIEKEVTKGSIVTATEQGKKVEEDQIFGGAVDHQIWTEKQQNPDHKLGRVNAANQGFTSRLDTRFGSMVIYKMYSKYVDALDKKGEVPFIHEVFDEIQTELQLEGKQLPECVWNDDTRYLVFKKNKDREEEETGDAETDLSNYQELKAVDSVSPDQKSPSDDSKIVYADVQSVEMQSTKA